jgi:hypothetical protein
MAEVTISHLSLDFGLRNAAKYNASSEVVPDWGFMLMRDGSPPSESLDQALIARANPLKVRHAFGYS